MDACCLHITTWRLLRVLQSKPSLGRWGVLHGREYSALQGTIIGGRLQAGPKASWSKWGRSTTFGNHPWT
eukprot:14697884-Alexandrium_andersonii.AAC.1